MNKPAKLANPGVRFPPPFFYLIGLGAAWLLETRVHQMTLVDSYSAMQWFRNIGGGLVILGLLLIFWGMLTFARARTAILPMRPASRLVARGPYRFTRNPMYTGMAVSYLGGAIGMNSVWALIMFPFVILLVSSLVISREERYLSSEFGEAYDTYRKTVRRWL